LLEVDAFRISRSLAGTLNSVHKTKFDFIWAASSSKHTVEQISWRNRIERLVHFGVWKTKTAPVAISKKPKPCPHVGGFLRYTVEKNRKD
jgi:hypothetical protein